MSYDWSTFSQKQKLKAPVQKIYDLWTRRSGLEYWFLRMAEFSRGSEIIPDDEPVVVGDTYRWRWHGYPDDITETGEVLEANGKDRLKFVFGKAGNVTVSIKDIGNGVSEMTITQSEIPTDDESRANFHVGCFTGWTFYRCNLKSILEGGADLRNKDNNDDMND